MTDAERMPVGPLANTYRQYRAVIWLAAAVAVYACLGFFLAPRLIQGNLVSVADDLYGATARVQRVEVNPFVLSLRVTGFELDDPAGAPVAGFAELYVNFQATSLFRWAWTFDEFRLTEPELHVARDANGRINLDFLASPAAAADAPAPPADAAAALPRIHVFNFVIASAAINWRDEVPLAPVDTRFGPINIDIADLSTLPDRPGQQAVLITTESEGTLSWAGTLNLNPLQSTAHASIKGSYFPLTSAYIRDLSGFEITEGLADVELDYEIDTLADGSLSAAVDNIELRFTDVIVKTFSNLPAATGRAAERQVLQVPELNISGGRLRWPEQQLAVDAVTLNDVRIDLFRDPDGRLNIDRSNALQAPDVSVPGPEPAAGSKPTEWTARLDRFEINHLALRLEDDSVQPQAELGIADLNLALDNLSNEPGARFPLSLSVEVQTGGSLEMTGDIAVLPEVLFDFDVATSSIALAGAHPYIRPLADVNLDSGALNLAGHLSGSGDDPLAFSGDIDIVDFEITETDAGTRLGSWKSMGFRKLEFRSAARKLDISEIVLDQAYGDIVIAEDGSLNLGRVSKEDGGAADPGDAVDGAAVPAGDASPFAVNVGRVSLTNAGADFADLSLPLPFSARIDALNGNLTTISTASSEPSTLSLEGKVDEFGFVSIGGHVTPLDPAANTDITVTFQNVDVPKFTAYTVPIAGREIASGSLDLVLGYQVRDSQLVGENSVVLRDFELGDKVEHPGAMSLPLGLAVALLKDPSGKIDIDLPVRGNLDDPEFSYGGVIGKALVNLIVKIVASPFSLLGNLLGIEADELEYLNFRDGRADLTPPELQRAAQLAEALALRPELKLEISGVVDTDADGLALRTASLDALVEERIGAAAAAGNAAGMYAEQRLQVLESMFVDSLDASVEAPGLDAIRAQVTTQPPTVDGVAPDPQFDALAYANELREQLIETLPLPDAALPALARERAENTRAAILAVNPALESRIVLAELRGVTRKRDEPIRMKVSLTASD